MSPSTKRICIYISVTVTVMGVMMFNGRNTDTEDVSDNLESRFINTTTQEKKELVQDYGLNDVADIEASIEKYKTIHLPRVEEELEGVKARLKAADNDTLRVFYREQLKRKLRERIMYKDALVGYQQLRTWYYENEAGVLG